MSDSLIFIDTNIYLDFYRGITKTFEKSMINHIENNLNRIIFTDQILMEYKKNRQKVMLDTFNQITIELSAQNIPAFLAEGKQGKSILKKIQDLKKQIETLKNSLHLSLLNPTKKDPIYKCMQNIIKREPLYYLNQSNEKYDSILNLATKRFKQGFPPKKNNDTSIGDAVNWEWIIACAETSKKDIILISRDTDYGITIKKDTILNDWLEHEFHERVSNKRKILLTNKLSSAMKLININISKREEDEEEKIITNTTIEQNVNKSTGLLSLLSGEEFALLSNNAKPRLNALLTFNDILGRSQISDKNNKEK